MSDEKENLQLASTVESSYEFPSDAHLAILVFGDELEYLMFKDTRSMERWIDTAPQGTSFQPMKVRPLQAETSTRIRVRNPNKSGA